jgi:predicted phosphodiesterase
MNNDNKQEVLECLKEAILHCRESDIPFSRDVYRAVAKHLDLAYKSDAAVRTHYGSWDSGVNAAYLDLGPVESGPQEEFSFLKQRYVKPDVPYRILVLPDIHVPFDNKKAVDAALQAGEMYEPDEVIQLGDLMDCYKLSQFTKEPERGANFQGELDEGTEMLRQIKKRTGAQRATMLEGNHEERLRRYLLTQAGALSNLRVLTIPTLLKLEEIGWDFMEAHEFYAINNVHFTHGEYAQKYSSRKHMEQYGVTIIHGHTHKLQWHCNKFIDRQIEAWEFGCLSSLNVSRDYIKCANWQHGFGTVTVLNDQYWINGYHIRDGRVEFQGKIIEGKE